MLLVQNIIRNATIYKDKTATEMDGRVNTWSEFTDRELQISTVTGYSQ